MAHTDKIYPGLDCSSIEFFNQDNKIKAFTKGKMVDFEDLPYTYHQILKDALVKEPETLKFLKEWHPESEMKVIEQFVKCRFGGLDFVPDIKNLELQTGEYWECPLRGSCKGEGLVCRSLSYNNHVLSNKEIKLLKLLPTSLTNEALCDEMEMPMGSFNLFKKELYQKLNIQTKQEAVVIAVRLNLI